MTDPAATPSRADLRRMLNAISGPEPAPSTDCRCGGEVLA
jgi:hypothetical protein